MPILNNLFDVGAVPAGAEAFETLAEGAKFRAERIVSVGHSSPEGFWYDQPADEWVVLLSGRARLRFEGEEPIEMRPGNHLTIPARRRHRVDWTEPGVPTVWLAIHYETRR